MKLLLTFLLLILPASALEVASLHPLMTDLVRNVGGSHVNVIEVGKPGLNPHTFQPRASDIRKMARCKLIFASGKGLETYLGDLSDSLAAGQRIIEVGRTIPSQKVTGNDAIYACCPTHAHGSIDPHWWHNVNNMERAAKVVGKVLAKADPANAAAYKAQARAYAAQMRQLDTWVKRQVAQIPKSRRHLVTSHAAYGYFCKRYKFKASFVQGLSREGGIGAQQLAETIQTIRTEGIKAVFPEVGSNPKVLQQIAQSSGVRVADPLIADGTISDYQKMIRGNVSSIVKALR